MGPGYISRFRGFNRVYVVKGILYDIEDSRKRRLTIPPLACNSGYIDFTMLYSS